ncbi:MAG TPA: efflux RND transporter periplasmic adaptor subunit [Fontimonas sp.]
MRNAKIAILATTLSLLAAGLSACSDSDAQDAAAVAPPPSVTVSEVLVKPLRDWDEFTGRLEAVNSVDIHPRVGGYVESVQFEEGSRVRKGQVLFQIDSRPYRAEVNRLVAEQQRAHAQVKLAKANSDRAQRLLDQNAISREEYDRIVTAAAAATADVGAVDASLEAARLNLEFTRVTAPIDGRVSRAHITVGNLVSSADLLTTLVSDDPIYAYFDTDEQTYLRYSNRDGEKSDKPVYMGLANEAGYPRAGRFDFIDNRLDPRTGTIRGRAVFANPDGALTPGLFARVRLVAGEQRERVLIDDRAVGADLGKKFVLALKADNTIEYRPVTLGPAVDGLRIVESGLAGGDVIVVNGLQHAKPGEAVTPIRAAMGSDGGQTLRQAGAESTDAVITTVARNGGTQVRSQP